MRFNNLKGRIFLICTFSTQYISKNSVIYLAKKYIDGSSANRKHLSLPVTITLSRYLNE